MTTLKTLGIPARVPGATLVTIASSEPGAPVRRQLSKLNQLLLHKFPSDLYLKRTKSAAGEDVTSSNPSLLR